ncbi:Anti-sigma-factor antagonist [Candidatus Sulfotelmatomonas gaucii]|uniref:Anti-sigma factor antagonist n=1 Tax=Candidatus Sulfuritelmatomonas gaucii TaxID=2043161 RepID=A0A2N9LAY7_9BACT|nr:Anti-sigma-factor antagonist [Candidatus Sulfotelmatomonas gaucii]
MTNTAVMNSLTFNVERKGETAIVRCRGRLVAGLCGDFYAKIKPLFADSKRVVLDLTDLDSVDSMGLGILVRLYASAKSAGSCLELINLNKKVRDLLGITNLLSLFGEMCEKGVAIKF